VSDSRRYLIVNADDFGLSEGVNRGILECAERGILTSTSLMVHQPAAAAAAAAAQLHPRLSIGLHVDLGEWVFRDGQWALAYAWVDAQDADAVAAELAGQLDQFRRLLSRDPTHLDSHQHVHRCEPVRSLLLECAERIGVPLRDCTPGIHFCGDFYGQTGEGEPLSGALTSTNLKTILAGLPDGVTELGCHPGYGDGLQSVYRVEREAEVRVLCDLAMRAALSGLNIELRSFADLGRSFAHAC
jgi:chitin disaccharide deacetylase